MSTKVFNLTYKQSKELISTNHNLKIIDVRSFAEYKEGHIHRSVNVSHDDLEYDIEELIPSKDDSILIYCRTGRRSHLAIETLKELGYKKIYHIYEGLSDWPYELNK